MFIQEAGFEGFGNLAGVGTSGRTPGHQSASLNVVGIVCVFGYKPGHILSGLVNSLLSF